MIQTDINALITAIGGREALQTLLGVGPSAISNYLAKGCLPKRAHPLVCQALQTRGYQLDPHSLQIVGLPPTPKSAQHHADTHITGKSVLMIVGGGIAAYKALEVSRRLQDHGITVTGVMTNSAQQFITPLSLSALTGQKTYTDLFSLTDEAEMGHIRLAREADLVLVVPATANLMARTAHGMADDLATCILLATNAPILFAPAMNPAMWNNPATRRNLAVLRGQGIGMIGPVSGDTACGEEGDGRMSEPADIVAATLASLSKTINTNNNLAGRRAIVTSGPTHEPIDAVRFIANRSSGQQGHAIAAALAARGAEVTLVTGPVSKADPQNVTVVHIETAAQMLAACKAALPADIAICAAAVADWRVDHPVQGKIKKQPESPKSKSGSGPPALRLIENPDILATLSSHRNRPQLVIGFAAETDDLQSNAATKRQRKGCDWIVANHVAIDDPANNVFGNSHNKASLFTQDGHEDWPLMPKTDLAETLIDKIATEFGANLVNA